MKKNFLMAAIAAIAVLASCTKEEPQGGVDVTTPGDVARIKINLSEVQTRDITGDHNTQEVDEDSRINDMIVFVTRADGKTFDVSPVYFNTSDIDGVDVEDEGYTTEDVLEVTATTKADHIYIVTNTGPFLTGPFSGVTNMDDVKAIALNINSNTHGSVPADYKCKYGNVWMAGDATVAEGDEVDHDDDDSTPDVVVSETDVQLHYVVAKVYIVTNNKITGTYGTNTRLDGVAMINAGAYTGVVNTNTSGSGANVYEVARTAANPQFPYYWAGVTKADGTYVDAPDQYEYQNGEPLANDYDVSAGIYTNKIGFTGLIADPAGSPIDADATTAEDLDNGDAFYVAPIRSGASVKSWATIFGKYNADGLDVDDTKNAPIFWSVAFAGSDNVIDEALTAGRKYIVTIELKGNDGNGAGGEDDPTTETVSEFMTINIDAAEWAVKHYTKTIN